MKKYITLTTITAMMVAFIWAAGAIFTPTIAEAKKTVYEKGDSKIQLGFRVQGRFRSLNEAEAVDTNSDGVNDAVTGRDYNFDFRRLRIVIGGQVNKLVSFFGQTDIGDKTGQEKMEWRDALITLNFAKSFRLSAGLFKIQLTRSRNGSGFGQLALDRPFVESKITQSANVDTKINGKRDQQVALWGNVDKFQYRLAVADGAKTKGLESDTLRYSARVHYAFLDAEKGFGYKETYQGKKRILTLGAGYDTQSNTHFSGETGKVADNTAYTVDLTFESPMNNGGVPNINAAYYSRNIDDNTASSQGAGYHVTAGYLFPGGKFQPYARYASWDSDAAGKDEARTNLGLNYLMKGHSAKAVLDLESVDYEKEGSTKAKQDHTIVTVQLQVDF